MSFRVKDYYSRLEWEIGRGGFGKVCVGYRQSEEEAEVDCFCEDCEAKKQVAIKLERECVICGKRSVKAGSSYLPHEAGVLNRLQGGPGIPRFFLYTRTDVPVRRSTPSRSSTPSSPRSSQNQNQGNYVKSPLSSPTVSTTSSAASAQLRGQSYDCQRPASALPKEPYHALVMQRLGKDLGSIFKRHILQNASSTRLPTTTPQLEHQYPHHHRPSTPAPAHNHRPNPNARPPMRRFEPVLVSQAGWDVDTVSWIGFNLLRSLEHMHQKGFVHRDIKPENMCIGAGNQRDSLFLIDYGMAKAYRNADGTHIDKPSDKAMCVGTQAFMSRRCQTSRRDDIESWFYVILYLYHGRLPWSTHAQKFEESFARSGQKWTKESITLNTDIQQQKEALFASGGANLNLPSELHLILRHISGLSFITKPDYRYLANALQSWRRTGRHQEKKVCLMHNHNNSPRATPGWKRKGYFDE